jgi:peroxiredoxin
VYVIVLKLSPCGCSLKGASGPLKKLKPKEDISLMLKVGDMAPDFELSSNLEQNKKVRLSDFRGKKNVVIAFYPLAWTPV